MRPRSGRSYQESIHGPKSVGSFTRRRLVGKRYGPSESLTKGETIYAVCLGCIETGINFDQTVWAVHTYGGGAQRLEWLRSGRGHSTNREATPQ